MLQHTKDRGLEVTYVSFCVAIISICCWIVALLAPVADPTG